MAERKQPERAPRPKSKRAAPKTAARSGDVELIPSEEAFGAPAVEDAGLAPVESAMSLPPPERDFLKKIGAAWVYVSTGGGRPLDLAVDALVIPADRELNFSGAFALHAHQVLGSSWDIFEKDVREAVGSGRFLTPESPVPVAIAPRPGAPLATLIAATAWAPQFGCAHKAGVERAVQAVIAACQRRSLRRIAIPLLGARGGGLPPVQVVRWILAAAQGALPAAPGIRELTIVAQEEDAYQEAITLSSGIPQRFANDVAGGDDLLDVASEVQALTDILLLRSLQPPLAVGILGGWGTGKSFAMDLMRRHIQRIRSLPPDGGWDGDGAGQYVGHIYPITFDAWTYAKSNLWASLMQTIFLELSRQVQLERRIREHLASADPDPELEGRLWLALQAVSDRDREALLDQESLKDHFQALSKPGAQLDSDAGKALWEALAKVKKEQQEILQQKEKELAGVSTRIEEEKAKLTKEVDRELESKAFKIAWDGAPDRLQEIVREALAATTNGPPIEEGAASIKAFLSLVGQDAAAVPLRFQNFRAIVERNPVISGVAALFFLALFGLGAWLATERELVTAAGVWIASFLTPLTGAVQAAKSWRTQVAAAWNGLERDVRAAESRVEKEREVILRQKLKDSPTAASLRQQEEKRRLLESEIQRLRQQIGFTADYISVADLVQARLCKAEYEGELGLLHRVQRDLDELSQALCLPPGHPHFDRLREQFPRGPARIVLFIDDLDRCPPDRVVEVLEAVQLLVKTPLFVVVLAMDVRYITRALEKVYKDILMRKGKPCGLDYIEKIIQLPYSVRPIDATHVERFLRGQMEIEAVAEGHSETEPVAGGGTAAQGGEGGREETATAAPKPVPAAVVAFREEELQWIQRSCEKLPLSPRAVKRVVNALKLLKIVWFRPNRHNRPEAPEVQEAFVALLALSAAYPNGMRSLFAGLSSAVQQALLPVPLHQTLLGLVPLLRCPEDELAGLKKNVDLIPLGASLGRELWATLELVRSLSFVAEIGYDPSDEPAPADDPGIRRLGA